MPIYDQSYAHWKGRLEGHVFRWLPIATSGIRLAFRSKLFLILFILVLAPFVFFAGTIILSHYALLPDFKGGPMRMLGTGEFYRVFLTRGQLLGVVAMCLFAGAPLVAKDMKSGALELYFSKPLLLSDYLMGKFMTIAFFLCCMTLFPALFLFLLDLLLSEEPGHLGEAIVFLPGILAVSAMIVIPASLIVLAASSLARTPRNAAVIWFAFHMALSIVSAIAAHIFGEINLELLNVTHSIRYLSRIVFDLREGLYDCPWTLPLFYLVLLTAGAFLILIRRVKGVDVIRS